MLKRFTHMAVFFGGFYTVLMLAERLTGRKAEAIFFSWYMVIACMAVLFLMLALLGLKGKEDGYDYKVSKVGILYVAVVFLVTASPVVLALVISLLFEVEFCCAFGMVEFFVFMGVAGIYIFLPIADEEESVGTDDSCKVLEKAKWK